MVCLCSKFQESSFKYIIVYYLQIKSNLTFLHSQYPVNLEYINVLKLSCPCASCSTAPWRHMGKFQSVWSPSCLSSGTHWMGGGLQTWSGHYGKEKKSLVLAKNWALFLKKYTAWMKAAYISRVPHCTALWDQKLSGIIIVPISQFWTFTMLQWCLGNQDMGLRGIFLTNFAPNFMKFDEWFKNWNGRIERHNGDLKSPFLFFQKKERVSDACVTSCDFKKTSS